MQQNPTPPPFNNAPRPPFGGNTRQPFQRQRPVKEAEHRINEKIRVPEVRLVGDDIEPGVYPTAKALEMAQEQELDLVEISPQAVPPVCKIMDYKKFLYEKKKKEKEIKAKSQKVVLKEIRFTANTDEHDVAFKVKHAENFIQEGCKIKCYVMFRGRDIVFKERGELLLLKFAQALEEIAGVESMPKQEGKRMFMVLAPKLKKK